jgi:hypothetical protein
MITLANRLKRGFPYNIKVNFLSELQTISTKQYSNDYEFWRDLVQLFVSVRDARFGISYPACYRAIIFALPLPITSSLENGVQVLRLSRYPDNIAGFTTVCISLLQFILLGI